MLAGHIKHLSPTHPLPHRQCNQRRSHRHHAAQFTLLTNFFVRTNKVTFDNVYIEATSNNASVSLVLVLLLPMSTGVKTTQLTSHQALPKNTDGFDSINVQGLTVTNTRVNVGDDCFSPKSNTSNILVENLWCNGTHGVSMGSVGQYPGVFDYISNAYIKNVTLLNGQNGARLKAWAGVDVGDGFIDNITYEDVYIENTVSVEYCSGVVVDGRLYQISTSPNTIIYRIQPLT